jgi:hypothetical protein
MNQRWGILVMRLQQEVLLEPVTTSWWNSRGVDVDVDVGCGMWMWDVGCGCGMWDVDVRCGMWMWDVGCGCAMWDVGCGCGMWDVGCGCGMWMWMNSGGGATAMMRKDGSEHGGFHRSYLPCSCVALEQALVEPIMYHPTTRNGISTHLYDGGMGPTIQPMCVFHIRNIWYIFGLDIRGGKRPNTPSNTHQFFHEM